MSDQENNTIPKIHERNTFIFLTVFLAPIVSVSFVAAFGFVIWFSQLLFGPTGS
jgi:nitrate reductase NapE